MSWKYVVIQVGNRAVPIIFPEQLTHSRVGEKVRDIFIEDAQSVMRQMGFTEEQLEKNRPALERGTKFLSAGSIGMLEVGMVSGKSASLEIASREGEDKEMINGYGVHGGLMDVFDDLIDDFEE